MNKPDLVESFWTKIHMEDGVRAARSHRKIPVTRAQAGAILDAAFETMKEALERGEEVSVPRFGKFIVKRYRDGATIRNPVTGARTLRPVGKMRVVKFKPSSVLLARVNEVADPV